eukprot:Skav230182  [mRNA]  locus=scaffold196:167023:167531:- [translate_table: standard]
MLKTLELHGGSWQLNATKDYPPAALGPCTGLFVVFFKFYDLLGRYVAPSSFVMSSERARADFPQMDGKRSQFCRRASWMKYVSVFYEGEHNDARTNLCIAFTAAMYGAAISNYAKVAPKKQQSSCT